MRIYVYIACFWAIALLPVKALFAQKQGRNTRLDSTRQVQYGIASFYADKFEGRKTANGETFSQQKMTAAHNTHPLGSWIRVTNLRNNRSVTLWVNDRLHHRNKRVVDLSKAAAKELRYINQGLTKVKVEYLGKRKPGSLPHK